MKVRNTICNICIVLLVIIFLLCLLWLCAGSFEMFPTDESEDKAHIAAAAGMVVCGLMAAGCIILKKKFIKQS